jgi:hypothetical protein
LLKLSTAEMVRAIRDEPARGPTHETGSKRRLNADLEAIQSKFPLPQILQLHTD